MIMSVVLYTGIHNHSLTQLVKNLSPQNFIFSIRETCVKHCIKIKLNGSYHQVQFEKSHLYLYL